jgi:hypothetical protein
MSMDKVTIALTVEQGGRVQTTTQIIPAGTPITEERIAKLMERLLKLSVERYLLLHG